MMVEWYCGLQKWNILRASGFRALGLARGRIRFGGLRWHNLMIFRSAEE